MRSRTCPVCDRDRVGKWTCRDCRGLVDIHRELFRNLQRWHIAYMQGDVPDVLGQDGQEYCLWDVITLYEARSRIANRQAIAIEICLYENIAETDAARRMGISPTSPVSIYATVGIARLLGMAARGEIVGYRLDLPYRHFPAEEDAEPLPQEGAA